MYDVVEHKHQLDGVDTRNPSTWLGLHPEGGGRSKVPRIAVCLVGFVRTLSEPRVYNAIERALRPPDASVDFFGAVSLGANESDTAKGQWGTVRHSDLKAALAVLRPRA
ncbi:hypothetical protein EMIHUDRAFT_256082 [Emiliania huxleyi CCMP1516]|uniref:Hexosyltransferase n=2 Tax=Emiliania huxleyi TaxID=2903 RepID=A0A0D3J079_EMIH1|nr:hypothetical protein EMIHUDRAFT_256082 [Emiliania huxleyi CCMP1516]EOD16914.1 hypothetical protein EMIHUDRAFT_256082 [Emiliania huxleyi CCMP1516]|eukprot:XP_005769343.1 hypothetical protein EMIHUDRAFT_256082 [Emiliania huxleyi CCMP1516]